MYTFASKPEDLISPFLTSFDAFSDFICMFYCHSLAREFFLLPEM